MAVLSQPPPLIAIPAAGSSSRMQGYDKLLKPVNGVPLLRRQALVALDTGCPVLVTLPDRAHARFAVLDDLDVEIAVVEDTTEGLSASLKKAAEHSLASHGMMVLLPDVPGIGTEELALLLDTFDTLKRDRPVQATDPEGRPGTPVLFPARLIPRFSSLSGDRGARRVLKDETVQTVAFADDRATRDLDTPEAWAAWRAETGIES